MKKIIKKTIKLLTIGIFSVFMLSACSSNSSNTSNINMNGSTSMEKLANAINESFMVKNPNVKIVTEFTGSSAGIEAVSNDIIDIANSSRALKDEELSKGLVENIVAIDMMGVIVNPSNDITNLTKQQLIDIYTGKIKNWKEVGGPDLNIVVIGREAGSGTRASFEEILNIKDNALYTQEIDSTGAVVGKVASIDGAIGYVSVDVVKDDVKLLNIDNIEPNIENIKQGSYFLSRYFIMVTKGDVINQKQEVQDLFDFIYSEEGRDVIESVGLIPVN